MAQQVQRSRPILATILGVLIFLFGLLLLFVSVWMIYTMLMVGQLSSDLPHDVDLTGLTWTIIAIFTIFAILTTMVGYGIINLRAWALYLLIIPMVLVFTLAVLTSGLWYCCSLSGAILIFLLLYLYGVRDSFT